MRSIITPECCKLRAWSGNLIRDWVPLVTMYMKRDVLYNSQYVDALG